MELHSEQMRRPPRPAISLLFSSSLAFWGSCAWVFLQLRAAEYDDARMWCIAATCSFAVSILLLAVSRKRFILVAVACAVGAVVGSAQASVQLEAAMIGEEGQSCIVRMEEDARVTEYGSSGTASLHDLSGRTCRILLYFKNTPDIRYGDTLRISFRVKGNTGPLSEYAWSKGVSCEATVANWDKVEGNAVDRVLLQARNSVIDSLGQNDDEDSMVLLALLCGYRPSIGRMELYGEYKRTGLAHFIAVSGAHLSIVFILFAGVFGVLRIRRQLSILLLGILILSYLAIAGEPISGMRAVAMAIISMTSLYGKRRPYTLNALAASILVLLALHPFESVSAGFCLSVLSCCGIILFASLFGYLIRRCTGNRIGFAGEALGVTIAASLASQPYACAIFALFPVSSGLSNVVCAPLFPLACASGLIYGMTVLFAPPLAQFVLPMSRFAVHAMNAVVRTIAEIPYAAIPFTLEPIQAIAISAIVAGVFYLSWNAVNLGHIFAVWGVAFLCLIAVYAYPFRLEEVAVLDVGQGDAILVRSGSSTILVDTGKNDAMLLHALARHHVAHLDCVIITHNDSDHCGSLDALKAGVQVDGFIVAKGMDQVENDSGRSLMEVLEGFHRDIGQVIRGDAFRIGKWKCNVVWPYALAFEGGNEDSICLALSCDEDGDDIDDMHILLAGDAESGQLEEMLDGPYAGAYEIVKVGHHGSQGALSDNLLASMKPSVALISVGAGNPYGHPHPDTIAQLERAGSRVFRTDLSGDVSCIMSADGLTVETQR